MTGLWHIFGGIIAYSIILCIISTKIAISPLMTALGLLLCLLGAIIPDIDTKSTIRGLIYSKWLLLVPLVLLILRFDPLIIGITTFVGILPFITRHRGLFHSKTVLIIAPIVAASIGYWHQPLYGPKILLGTIFFISGTISHLLLDKFKN
jgi:hypothetical protein